MAQPSAAVHSTASDFSRFKSGRTSANRVRLPVDAAALLADSDSGESRHQSKDLQQPDHDADHNDRVENAFDFSVHGNVGIHQPKHDADGDKNENEIYKRHEIDSPVRR
jgi:hypothetical protein